MISRVAGLVDRVFYEAALARGEKSRKSSKAEGLGHDERMKALDGIASLYPRHGEPDGGFFVPPSDAIPTQKVARRFGRGGEVLDLTWPSRIDPHVPGLRDKLDRVPENRVAHARLYTIPGAHRPALIVIHGYMSGRYAVDEALFPLELFLRRGFDVALLVLPFHGPRRGARPRPMFPASDPRITIEGFRQAVHDAATLGHILRRRGAPEVGVTGMSLGGYTSALLATTLPDLSFAIPLVPLASIADFARDGGRLVGSPEEQRLQHEAIDRAHRIVSPVLRPLALPASRVVVVGGERDAITPVTHAKRLAAHFGCALEVFGGGHLLQRGRDDAYERAFARLGFA